MTFESFTSRLGITEEDRVLPMTPLTRASAGMCLYCMRLGAPLVMLREPHWNAEHCLETAAAARATVNGRRADQRDPDAQPADLPAHGSRGRRRGSPTAPEIAQRWENSTGSQSLAFTGRWTPASSQCAARPIHRIFAGRRWVGRTIAAEWKIVDGEICMRGDLVQDRYWGEDAGPYAEDGWAHMGDLGFVDESGFLHVVGRVKDIIIRGGTNINPYEVESLLRMHPAVLDACVVGRPDAELGEVPVAFIVGDADIRRARPLPRGQRTCSYKWPAAMYSVGELPAVRASRPRTRRAPPDASSSDSTS